jgi:hypothetical protein
MQAFDLLVISDISILNKIAVGLLERLAENEIVQKGRFILVMVIEYALAEGMKAEAVVRSGVLC